jgi:protein-tyrosine phosphatase
LCYGNIYRSPFVAAYLRRVAARSGGLEVRSAGFYPKSGRASSTDYVNFVLRRTGIDLSGHRSRVVTESDLTWADLIIIMDRHNWYDLAKAGSTSLSRVVWLGAFRGSGPPEIEDPYGKSEARMRQVVDELSEASSNLCDALGLRRPNSYSG